MTVREFIERIADVCKCIESCGGEVERGEVNGEINGKNKKTAKG